jgi:hypothetical protein
MLKLSDPLSWRTTLCPVASPETDADTLKEGADPPPPPQPDSHSAEHIASRPAKHLIAFILSRLPCLEDHTDRALNACGYRISPENCK